MLRLKDINVCFGDKHILRNLSCDAKKGDFIVVLGTNGAGKSSFFDTIAGRVNPKSGIIEVDGQEITKLSEQHRAKYITRIFQNTHLNSISSFTVEQNLAVANYSRRYATLSGGMNVMPHEKAKEIVSNLGMSHSILNKKMKDLSGGQRQLIAFAMSTQLIPKLLLLDEPTAALDPQAATNLLQYAVRFIKEHDVTTLLITHDPQIALNLGNKIWILEEGKIHKVFDSNQKKDLTPEQLIGQIDYKKIAYNS